MKTILRKTSCVLLAVILFCSVLPLKAAASYEISGTCQVQVDGGSVYTVKTLDYSYEHNTYLSLRDLAMLLKGTGKEFSLEVRKNAVSLNPGEGYVPAGTENATWETGRDPDLTLRRNEFKVNGQDVRYYTLIMKLASGDYDCFMMAADLAMILDMDITASGDGLLQIDTGSPLRVLPAELEQAGYFYGVNGVLVGDATTGEVYYQYQSDVPCPIASTSKLMTCLLAMEAIGTGEITAEDVFTVSGKASALAASDDGVISLKQGEQITVQDLLLGALLPSSNECALCLAEGLAGSEEAFVERMNRKARELGLSQALFFNSNGLPVYTEDPVPAKCQNRMSASDMFRLASYLLRVYPQVKDITSLREAVLSANGYTAKNTNPLLYNLPGVTGLKTGTTNKAGACLVTSLAAYDGVMEHDLVVVVLGTEDTVERGRVSGLLAKYALQAFAEGRGPGAESGETGTEGGKAGMPARQPGELPTHAEAAVERILRTACGIWKSGL